MGYIYLYIYIFQVDELSTPFVVKKIKIKIIRVIGKLFRITDCTVLLSITNSYLYLGRQLN